MSSRLFHAMSRARYRFMDTFNRDPVAYLLGPKQFLAFQRACLSWEFSKYISHGPGSPHSKTTFCGLPVKLKTRPGIDFEIRENMLGWVMEGKRP